VKALAHFVVRVFDLVEAEGATLRAVVRAEGQRFQAAASSAALAAAILLIAVALVLAGCGLLSAALLWWLETITTPPVAAAATGAVLLALGSGIIVGVSVLTPKARP
jgi:hypothetical protein